MLKSLYKHFIPIPNKYAHKYDTGRIECYAFKKMLLLLTRTLISNDKNYFLHSRKKNSRIEENVILKIENRLSFLH